MSNLQEFDGKPFVDVMRGDPDLPGADKEEPADEAETSALTERIKGVLDELVEDVRPSQRLTDSPACLVLGAHDPGAQMRKILEATGQSMPESKPVFEYNAAHPLLERLDQEADEDRIRDLVLILFDQASLADGTGPKDSAAYVNGLNQLLLSLLKDWATPVAWPDALHRHRSFAGRVPLPVACPADAAADGRAAKLGSRSHVFKRSAGSGPYDPFLDRCLRTR